MKQCRRRTATPCQKPILFKRLVICWNFDNILAIASSECYDWLLNPPHSHIMKISCIKQSLWPSWTWEYTYPNILSVCLWTCFSTKNVFWLDHIFGVWEWFLRLFHLVFDVDFISDTFNILDLLLLCQTRWLNCCTKLLSWNTSPWLFKWLY